MFHLILGSAWSLMHLYVFWRASTVPAIRRRVPRPLLFGSGALLWSAYFISPDDGTAGMMARALDLFVMNWMAALFLATAALLAVDLITGFGFVFRRRAPALRGWALAAGCLLSLAALYQGMRSPVVRSYEVSLPGLPAADDGVVLMAVSDLHLGSMLGERWLEARVDQILEEKPDLVVLLGDLFEGHGRPPGLVLPALRRLKAPLGVWAVNGNHESYGGGEATLRLLGQAGIPVLRDRWAEVSPGFILAGVDDLTSRRRAGQNGDYVGRALAGRPPGAAVLLSHSPLEAERAASAGAGLMLSGHTHGGQVWPFWFVVRLTNPLVGGRYEVDGMTVLVSRGTGTWGPRMRLWYPGEILRITLRAAPIPEQAWGRGVPPPAGGSEASKG